MEGERESEEWKGRDSQVLEVGLRGMHTLVSAVGLRGATARVGAAHVQHYHTHSCLCRKEMKRESAARSTRVEPQEDGLDGLLHPSPPYWEPHPSLDWRQMARDKGIVEVGAEKALK